MEQPTATNHTLLIVDDDLNFLTLMQEFLEEQGYKIVVSNSGQEALKLLDEIEPDLIISDVMMPEMNGYNFLEKVRENPRTSWIPAIFVSAKSQSQDRVRGLNAGASAYMVKPFDLSEFVAQIESSIRAAHLSRQNHQRKAIAKLRVPAGVKLTQAELTVARLVTQGLSNQEISQKLNISKRTTESHISHILKKTELSNRTELSRWIMESELD